MQLCLSLHFLFRSFTQLSVCLSICLSVRLSVCPYVHLSVCPSVLMEVILTFFLHRSVCQCVCIKKIYGCLFACLSVRMFVPVTASYMSHHVQSFCYFVHSATSLSVFLCCAMIFLSVCPFFCLSAFLFTNMAVCPSILHYFLPDRDAGFAQIAGLVVALFTNKSQQKATN